MNRFNVQKVIFLILILGLLSGCSKSSGSYYKEGMKYFSNGNYAEAEVNFAKAIEVNPERAEYYINYGMTLIMLDKGDKALLNFDKAILKKDNAIVNKNNKMAYRGKGIAFLKAHQYAAAIEQFNTALEVDELSDLNMDILYYKANAQEAAGYYKEAADTYSIILEENSKDADIYSSRAFAYRKLGDTKKSLDDYDQAISLAKTKYDYYFGKYFLLLELEDTEGAKAVLNEAEKITVKTQEDKFNLAKIHYYKADYDVAIKEFGEAFKNGFAAAYFYLGGIYEEKEDYKSAINNYKMFIEDATTVKTASVYNQIGMCLIKQEQYEEALTYIQKGLEFKDIFLDQALKQNEIIAYENIGDYNKAYHLMTEYIERYPEDKEAATEYEFLKTRLPEASTFTEKEKN